MINKWGLAFTATLAGIHCAPKAQTASRAKNNMPIQAECKAELSHLLNICSESGIDSEIKECAEAERSLGAAVTVLGMCRNATSAIDETCEGQNIARFKVEAGKHRRIIERIILDIRENYANQCLFDESFEEDTAEMNKSLDELGLPHVPGSKK